MAGIASVASLLFEGAHGIVPIPPNQYEFEVINSTMVGNTTLSVYEFYQYKGDIEIFCLEEHCIFGWMSTEWVYKVLIFGLWIGVFCIAGFNYAVSVANY